MANEHFRRWNSESPEIISFFEQFPVRNQTDRDILNCDLDLLQSTVEYFSSELNCNLFAEQHVESMKKKSWVSQEYIDKVTIPHYFFKGLFHRWEQECLAGIRIGNPSDPSYKYSYEVPQVRTYSIFKAFSAGARPCPNCFEIELRKLFELEVAEE